MNKQRRFFEVGAGMEHSVLSVATGSDERGYVVKTPTDFVTADVDGQRDLVKTLRACFGEVFLPTKILRHQELPYFAVQPRLHDVEHIKPETLRNPTIRQQLEQLAKQSVDVYERTGVQVDWLGAEGDLKTLIALLRESSDDQVGEQSPEAKELDILLKKGIFDADNKVRDEISEELRLLIYRIREPRLLQKIFRGSNQKEQFLDFASKLNGLPAEKVARWWDAPDTVPEMTNIVLGKLKQDDPKKKAYMVDIAYYSSEIDPTDALLEAEWERWVVERYFGLSVTLPSSATRSKIKA